MWKHLLALSLAVVSQAQAAEMIQVSRPVELRSTKVKLTSTVVEGMLQSPDHETQELTDAEARALAEAQGIELPASSGDQFGRPWFLIKAGVGLPNLVSASIEVFVHRNWTVELGAGVGLLPTVFEGSIRWRPDATCWGCDGRNFFSIGFGIDPGVYFGGEGSGGPGSVGVMVAATVDLLYIHRFAKHFGFSIGTRLGAGVVTEFGGSRDWTHVEPALKITLLQIGLVF